MTGFGRAALTEGNVTCTVEFKSVNFRVLELIIRNPLVGPAAEAAIRGMCAAVIGRGRIEMTVTRTFVVGDSSRVVSLERPIVDQWFNLYRGEFERYGIECTQAVKERILHEILKKPGVWNADAENSSSTEAWDELLIRTATEACNALMVMKVSEGQRLVADIHARLAKLKSRHSDLAQWAAQSTVRIAERLAARLSGVDPRLTIPEERLAQEVVLLVDRTDVTEEIIRFASHLSELELALGLARSGRKIDFILQELSREANTIASKCQDAAMQGGVVDVKSELERIREQVQNLE
jgi:uncharacterized protein (TIGR00255 family)